MKTTKITGTIRALSPIHHGGDEKTGSEVMIRRIKYLVGGDEMVEVPVLSGNGIRGSIRRNIMRDMCDAIGYVPTVRMYHTLFAGGVLESVGSGKGHLDLQLREDVRTLVPPIALLGCGMFNQILSSKLQVGLATPVCRELNEYHPETHQSPLSFYELLGDAFHTRKDDLHAVRSEDETAVQMMYTFETLSPGTRLCHAFTLLDANKVEESCLRRMVELWEQDPHVGGKSATGFGQVELTYDWLEDFPTSEPYLEFITEHKDEILGLFATLEEAFSSVKKAKRQKKKQKKIVGE